MGESIRTVIRARSGAMREGQVRAHFLGDAHEQTGENLQPDGIDRFLRRLLAPRTDAPCIWRASGTMFRCTGGRGWRRRLSWRGRR
jgi:hypothetical protein